jgi:hypothetical protein
VSLERAVPTVTRDQDHGGASRWRSGRAMSRVPRRSVGASTERWQGIRQPAPFAALPSLKEASQWCHQGAHDERRRIFGMSRRSCRHRPVLRVRFIVKDGPCHQPCSSFEEQL